MARKNRLFNGKTTDKYIVEKDGVYKLSKYVVGSGKWLIAFEQDIKELATFIKSNDIFIYNWKEYQQMLQGAE